MRKNWHGIDEGVFPKTNKPFSCFFPSKRLMYGGILLCNKSWLFWIRTYDQVLDSIACKSSLQVLVHSTGSW